MSLGPEDRYPTRRALAEDVERWMADEPVTAWREPRSVRARRWVKKHRTLVTSATAALLVAGVAVAYAAYSISIQRADLAARAVGWVETLVKADIGELPRTLQTMPDRPVCERTLTERMRDPHQSPRARLHLALALVAIDPSSFSRLQGQLFQRMLEADPDQLRVIGDQLETYRDRLIPGLWEILSDVRVDADRRFRAGCILAKYDPWGDEASRPRWAPHGPFLVESYLAKVMENASYTGPLAQALLGVAPILFDPLLDAFRDRRLAVSSRRAIAVSLLRLYDWRPEETVELLLNADASEFPAFEAKLKDRAGLSDS